MREKQLEKGANMAQAIEETYFLLHVQGGGMPVQVRVNHDEAVRRAEQLAVETLKPVLLFKAIEKFVAIPPEGQTRIQREVLS